MIAVSSALPVLTFMIGSCWLLITSVKDITNDVCFLKLGDISEKNIAELKELFCKLVEFYVNVTELIDDLNSIHEFIIFVFFVWVLLNVCCVLLVIQALIVVSFSYY